MTLINILTVASNWCIPLRPRLKLKKNPRPEKPKLQGPKLLTILKCLSNQKLVIKAWQKKKKDCQQRNQQQKPQKGSTSAIGVNTAKPEEPKQKKKNRDQNRSNKTLYDISHITCYNCKKKDYYLNACIKYLKN